MLKTFLHEHTLDMFMFVSFWTSQILAERGIYRADCQKYNMKPEREP